MKWINMETLKQQDFQDYSPSDVMQAIDDCPAVDTEELITKLCNIFSSGKSADVSETIQPQKPYTDSTLWNMCKKDLIQYIRELEYNRNAATARLQQQAENVKDWKPVVHSHWEYDEDNNLYCKRCGAPHGGGFSYCSYCGARMDGDTE